ncbi:MAG: SAF domain-containing protein [Thermocrispum agreste]|uniref:SAF domain-containing protein n=1 Tax=Thermocrispum agreste TaxID=37925 RepID=A0ABD6FBW1_9PSEU
MPDIARVLRSLVPWLSRRPRPRRHIGRGILTATGVRRVLAVLLMAAAAVLAVRPASSAGEPRSPAVVTSRDVAPWRKLEPPDLRVVRLPRSALPDGVLTRPEAAVGRMLSGPARRGEPLTDARLVSPVQSTTSGAGDTATVPIRLADGAVAALLRPGALVDVVTVTDSEEGVRTLASGASVVAVTESGDAGPGEHDARLVLLELPTARANRVAAVSLSRPVTVTLR